MDYKVLITTSGTGSRLKELTKHQNKTLVPVAGRPTIEYILDHYDPAIPLVVTVGYLAEQVTTYLRQYHADRQIEFVQVNPYEGPGASLGFSMLQAKATLQCPFIFHACDTIVQEQIPVPDHNWTIGYKPPSWDGIDTAQYRTHKTNGRKLLKLNDKGVPDFTAIHIGLTGIFDYQVFWDILTQLYHSNPADSGWSDVHVIDAMVAQGIVFESIPFRTWLDTGNLPALAATEQYLGTKK